MISTRSAVAAACALASILAPVTAFGADAYDTYKKFATHESAEDGVATVVVKTTLSDSKSGGRIASVLAATSTSLGGDIECDTALGLVLEADGAEIETAIDATCRTVSGQEYVRLDGGWISINGTRGTIAGTPTGEGLVGRWFKVPLDEISSDGEAAARAAKLLLEDEAEMATLGPKDAKYSIATVDGKAVVTAKLTAKAKVVKKNPILKGATVTFTGDPTTGEVSRVEVISTVKEKNLRLTLNAVLADLGGVPAGTKIVAPGGSIGSAAELEGALDKAIEEAIDVARPVYVSSEDRFSIKFDGVPTVKKEVDRKEGTLTRTYLVESSDTTAESVAVTTTTNGNVFVTTWEETERVFAARIEEIKDWWGKKAITHEKTMDFHGYRAQRIYAKISKAGLYFGRFYVCTEDRCFQITAITPDQEETETRLDRLVESFTL